jgi:hypothetical protein
MEDIWFGDDRRGTGWTLAKFRVLGFYYEERAKKEKQKPKAGGKLFVIQKADDKFKMTWDISEEK